MRTLSVAPLGLLALSLHAQAGPGAFGPPSLNPGLQSLGTAPRQVSFERLPGDPAGTWTACITLSSTLVMGKYDQVNGTFTQNSEAANLQIGSPFGLMLEPGLGRYAVFDTSSGVYFAARSAAGVAFTTSALVTGVPGTYVDPSLGYVGGKLKLFYVSPLTPSNSIVMQDLDITNPATPFVSGTPVIVAKSSSTSSTVHSPSPITGPDGDVEGLMVCENVSTDSDVFFKAGLDPSVTQIKIVDGTNWRNNGGIAGGHLIYRDTGIGVSDLAVAWLLGDVEPPGGTLDIFGAVANKANLATTTVCLSSGVIAPVQLPPPLNNGAFALDPTVFLSIGTFAHTDATQLGSMKLPVPNNPILKGLNLAIQGLSFVPATTTYAFTNTAWLSIQ